MSIRAGAGVFVTGLVIAAGCSSSDDTTAGPPANGSDAGSDVMQEGAAGAAGEGGIIVPDANPDAPGCPSEILCGSTGICCAVGQECSAGTCVTACASGVRCASACCQAGDVCVSGQCKTPTTSCIDSVDCVPTEFCEPLTGKCVEQVPGGTTCEVKHPVVALAPVLKWSWTVPDVLPEFDQAISAPLVVDADQDGTPDVFVTTGNKSLVSLGNPGYLRLLDGATGKEKWGAQVDALQPANQVQVTSSPAIADLDGDGKVEVITLAASLDVIAFHADGSLAWRSKRADTTAYMFSSGFAWGSALSVADMDGDGKGEVALAGVVFGSDGVLVSGEGKESVGGLAALAGHIGTSSIVADVNGDGTQELIGGNGAWSKDGTQVWTATGAAEGFPGIADFDKDGKPELVVASGSQLRVHNAVTGEQLSTAAIGGIPGPPVIADFDGDGTPEIGLQYYQPCQVTVFEYDAAGKVLSEKWTRPMIACSGYLTPTAFDFNGDGEVEVLAHDDCHVNVIKGTTGEIQLRIAASHNTWTEFVSVADVDGDSEADLIFSANDAWNGGLLDWAGYCGYQAPDTWSHGVFVYHQPKAWMPTRRVWNQQSYHITNVRADGSLPASEAASWGPAGYNNYRVSAQGKGAELAPNLSLSLSASLSVCPAQVKLVAQVQNTGSVGVAAGVKVAFYEGQAGSGKLLGTATTQKAIAPGGSESVTLDVTAPVGAGAYYAAVDSDGTVPECIDDDNEASVNGVTCTKLY